MPTAAQAFKSATLYTDDTLYRMIKLPAPAIWAAASVLATVAEAFSAIIADKDEVTLVLSSERWEMVRHRLPDHEVMQDEYRLITFDLPLEPDLVGFMALVSQILADANVTILPLAAFSRDHILVTDAQFQQAWNALSAAQSA